MRFQLPVNIRQQKHIYQWDKVKNSIPDRVSILKYIIKEIFFYRARPLHIANKIISPTFICSRSSFFEELGNSGALEIRKVEG